MNSVRVLREMLLAKLRENRQSHRSTFEKAIEGYRREAVKELESMLEDARKGKKIRRSVELIEPTDQTRDYDRVIAMMEMSVDETIELMPDQFAQLVMDDWAWKAQFTRTTSNYL